MDERVTKYLIDIRNAIAEIETASEARSREFEVFVSDFVFRKFVERDIEIIGEAMNRVLRINPEINITSARKIVDTRNYVIHSYDSLIPEILWAIVVNHLPCLKAEVDSLLAGNL
ncbi:HepT-like ribonuclease domain-containing protein [uncultured Muribaculum sp.]|uniref:HepT-like ribonuclease domain-containing protein n=1 Tax=uncultured Muribaculum sp. TaxID=1918613 RepID=UPI0025E6DA26|nr:HepT-like ribonuclease domain-containing protein [uncultured Muribaculum sp.]